MMDGVELTTLDIDGREVSVTAEYPEGEYRTVNQLSDIILSKPSGGYVALTDVARFTIRTARLLSPRRIRPMRLPSLQIIQGEMFSRPLTARLSARI